jgi:hypothetical protein
MEAWVVSDVMEVDLKWTLLAINSDCDYANALNSGIEVTSFKSLRLNWLY